MKIEKSVTATLCDFSNTGPTSRMIKKIFCVCASLSLPGPERRKVRAGDASRIVSKRRCNRSAPKSKFPLALHCKLCYQRVTLALWCRVAGVAKLVDAPDLGSGAARRGGSSPSTRTIGFIIWPYFAGKSETSAFGCAHNATHIGDAFQAALHMKLKYIDMVGKDKATPRYRRRIPTHCRDAVGKAAPLHRSPPLDNCFGSCRQAGSRKPDLDAQSYCSPGSLLCV